MKKLKKLEDKFYTKFDSVYDGFMEIARKGISIITELNL
jgi:hypothetical protein